MLYVPDVHVPLVFQILQVNVQARADNLENSEIVKKALLSANEKSAICAAICAAPSILGAYGFLKERKATSYPGFDEALVGAEYVQDAVAVSDFIITSRGMGTAIPFSLALIEILLDKEKAEELGKSIIYYQ